MAPLIERVCSPAVCSFGSKIYVFGGQEGVTMKGYPGMFEDCVLHLSFYIPGTYMWTNISLLVSPIVCHHISSRRVQF